VGPTRSARLARPALGLTGRPCTLRRPGSRLQARRSDTLRRPLLRR